MSEELVSKVHESVDSASPIDALKVRIIEMAEIGKNPNEPTQNSWRQRDVQGGFGITLKAIFVPEAYALNDEDDLSGKESNDSNAGLAVLVRDISNLDGKVGSRSKPIISYLVRIGEGEDPVLIIDRKSIFHLKGAKDSGVSFGDIEDSLTDIISEDEIHLEQVPTIKLTDRHNEFLQKLLDSLNRDKLDLIQDESSSDH